jgi:hypothetical protein
MIVGEEKKFYWLIREKKKTNGQLFFYINDQIDETEREKVNNC